MWVKLKAKFAFLHKPKVYGVARLLYSVATSDSLIMTFSHRTDMATGDCKIWMNAWLRPQFETSLLPWQPVEMSKF